ncbi:MAG: AAA family ATPase [Phycisphaerales bacterium]
MPDWAWEKLARVEGARWAIPERDASGEIIGTAYREANEAKSFAPGGKRGAIVAWPLNAYAGSSAENPVYVCEGATDTAALLGLDLDAVGVPMAGQCGAMLAELLAGRHAAIVADADQAGRRGALKLADSLLRRCLSVRIIEPPGGAKDAREAVIAGADRAAFAALASGAEPMKPRPEPIDGAPVLVRLCDVKPEAVAWLWYGRLALGKLTLIASDPGLGKSLVTLDIAARVSTGSGWPDGCGAGMAPGGVVLLSAEDAIADTIRPRLDAAGADARRIIVVEAVHAAGHAGRALVRPVDLSLDLPAIEVAIKSMEECRLVVIDPVTAYLGGVDSHKNADVRGVLAPLAELATRHRVAVVAVTHLNKSGGGPAIYRAMGSLAFTAAARTAWTVSKDRNDPSRRFLLPMKNNLSPDAGGLAYRIETAGADGSPIVAWESDPVFISADDALGGDRDRAGGRTERDDAVDWLRDFLADGPKPAREVLSEAKAAGFSKRTLDRAKPMAGVLTRKDGISGGWVWSLDDSSQERQPSAEDCHTPECGNLRENPGDSTENHTKAATFGELATFNGSAGALGEPDPGDGWGEL